MFNTTASSSASSGESEAPPAETTGIVKYIGLIDGNKEDIYVGVRLDSPGEQISGVGILHFYRMSNSFLLDCFLAF